MEKWLISVKNSNKSLFFANFGCFGMFRVKKQRFCCPKLLKKANFQGATPMVYNKNDFKFRIKPPGGTLLWDT